MQNTVYKRLREKANNAKFDIKNMLTSKKLAEFTGILTGDGYISRTGRTYKFGVVGDVNKEKDYLGRHVKGLVEELFQKTPTLTYRVGALRLNFYSKKVAEFLISLGFPLGKKGNLPMLDFIKKDKTLWSHFIRGVFDTDGCIFWDKRKIYKKPYPRINMYTVSTNLADDIIHCLEQMGFVVYKQNREGTSNFAERYKSYVIELYGYKNLKRWRELIGSSNTTKMKRLNKPQ